MPDSDSKELAPIRNMGEARAAASNVPMIHSAAGFAMSPSDMGNVIELASLMAQSKQAVPSAFRGEPGLCLAVAMRAFHLGFEPFSLIDKAYVVNDKVAFESQAFASIINTRAPIQKPLDCRYEGEIEGTHTITRGKGQYATNIEMPAGNRTCTVIGYLKGADEERTYTTPELGKIKTKNSPLWETDPDQQLFYYAMRNWARRWAPEAIMGVYSRDEMQDSEIVEHQPVEKLAAPGESGIEKRLAKRKEDQDAKEADAAAGARREDAGRQNDEDAAAGDADPVGEPVDDADDDAPEEAAPEPDDGEEIAPWDEDDDASDASADDDDEPHEAPQEAPEGDDDPEGHDDPDEAPDATEAPAEAQGDDVSALIESARTEFRANLARAKTRDEVTEVVQDLYSHEGAAYMKDAEKGAVADMAAARKAEIDKAAEDAKKEDDDDDGSEMEDAKSSTEKPDSGAAAADTAEPDAGSEPDSKAAPVEDGGAEKPPAEKPKGYATKIRESIEAAETESQVNDIWSKLREDGGLKKLPADKRAALIELKNERIETLKKAPPKSIPAKTEQESDTEEIYKSVQTRVTMSKSQDELREVWTAIQKEPGWAALTQGQRAKLEENKNAKKTWFENDAKRKADASAE